MLFVDYILNPNIYEIDSLNPSVGTVVATFHGSQSYYGTYAETSFTAVSAPAATPTSQATQQLSYPPVGMYIVAAAIAIIVAIAIGIAVVVLMLRKRP